MKLVAKSNYGGIKKFTSAKTQKMYHSMVVIDESNQSVEISIPDEILADSLVKLGTVKRFAEIEFTFDLSVGQYTRMTLISV